MRRSSSIPFCFRPCSLRQGSTGEVSTVVDGGGFGVPVLPVVRLLEQVVATALVGRDQTHLDRPGVRERTMTVDASGTSITEFGIGRREKTALVERGRTAARVFLHGWEGRTG